MTVAEFILGGLLLVSIMYCVTLYNQREALARENSEKDLTIEILTTEKKKILALVARFASRSGVAGSHMAVSGNRGEPVSVESMEK